MTAREDGVLPATAVHQAHDTLVEYELGRVSFYDWKGVASESNLGPFTDVREIQRRASP